MPRCCEAPIKDPTSSVAVQPFLPVAEKKDKRTKRRRDEKGKVPQKSSVKRRRLDEKVAVAVAE